MTRSVEDGIPTEDRGNETDTKIERGAETLGKVEKLLDEPVSRCWY